MLVIQSIDEPSRIEDGQKDTAGVDPNLQPEGPIALGPPPSPTQDINWTDLVQRIQSNDQPALEELYTLFSRGIKFLIVRQLGRQDIDDRVHDTFVIVVQAIQRGELRDPERLMGFVRTIVRRQIASFIEKNYTRRRDELDIDGNVKIADSHMSPEEGAIRSQNSQIKSRAKQRFSDEGRRRMAKSNLKSFFVRKRTAS